MSRKPRYTIDELRDIRRLADEGMEVGDIARLYRRDLPSIDNVLSGGRLSTLNAQMPKDTRCECRKCLIRDRRDTNRDLMYAAQTLAVCVHCGTEIAVTVDELIANRMAVSCDSCERKS